MERSGSDGCGVNFNNLDILNPLHHREWNEFLISSKECSPFHTSNWARTLNESYGFTPRYFSAFEGGKLSALIPVMEVKSFLTGCRGVSLPFSDFCESILPFEMTRGEQVEQLTSYGRAAGWKYLELRGERGVPDNTPGYRSYFTHTIDLSCGENQLYHNLRSSTRRNIEKAKKERVCVKSGTSFDFVDSYYRLNCLTRKQHGVPPQPFIFFVKLHEQMIAKGMGKVLLAEHDGNCIAGAVLLHYGEKVLYKFGASNRDYQHLRANNLVMWEGILNSCKNGYRHFSFGRTEPENEGLRQFKNGWGADEEILRYYRYSIREERYLTAEDFSEKNYAHLISMLPMPLLKFTGKCLYRHMG